MNDPPRFAKNLAMTDVYVCSPEIRVTELDGEGVVLSLTDRQYYTVSSSGLLILTSLKTEKTLEQIIELLLDTYEVNREEATETATAFLDQCIANGMVDVAKRS